MIKKQEGYETMWHETKEWCREIAVKVMGWQYDEAKRVYYIILGGNRLDIRNEWEFDPISDAVDAMDALTRCADKNDCHINIHRNISNHEDHFECLWDVTLGYYDYKTKETKEYIQGNDYLELAICAIISDVYNIEF